MLVRRALLMLLVVGLAGCSSGNDVSTSGTGAGTSSNGHVDPGTSTTGTSATHSSGASTPPAEGNEAPTATISVTMSESGIVRFELNGTDPEGDAITWTLEDRLEAGTTPLANGTQLPHVLETTLAAGPHKVYLSVSDGAAVTEVLSEFTLAEVPHQIVDGSFVAAAEGCWGGLVYGPLMTDPGASAGDDLNETTRVQFAVASWTWNRTFTADFTFDQGYLEAHVAFFDAEGVLLDSFGTTSPNFGGLQVTGDVPYLAARGLMMACAGPTQASVHYLA